MVLLDFTFDVRSECNSGERVPREKLGTCNFLNSLHEHLCFCLLIERVDSNLTLTLQVDPNLEEPLGIAVLNSRGFFPHAYWYWISVGALTGFTLLFNFLYTVALTYLNGG